MVFAQIAVSGAMGVSGAQEGAPDLGGQIAAYWNRTDFPARVETVAVTSDRIHITGHAPPPPPGAGLFLAEIRPHEEVTQPPRGRFPRVFALPSPNPEGAFVFEVPRLIPAYDQVFSKWAVLARSLTQPTPDILLSHAAHPTDLRGAARWPDLPPTESRTKKGLAGIHPDPALFPDLADLGIGHLTHNIPLGTLLRPEAGPDTWPFDFAGRRYHFSRTGTEVIDRVTTFAQSHGIVVTAIILVPNLPDRTAWAGRVLTHPRADPSAIYSMANVATFEGVSHYAAAMRFLAERYGQPGFPHGRISHWIIHNEVDSGWVWTNAGVLSAPAYLDQYAKSMRIAHHAVRSVDPRARVYISLTHHWSRPHRPGDPRFFPSRTLLEWLGVHGRAEGDFDWGLAFHPYPQHLFHARTWEDADALDHEDTPYLTLKNIEVLDRWARRPPNRFQGKDIRPILLSEQGFHTPDGSEASQTDQAAALVYAWKKIGPIDSIKAFHYHRWIDHEQEGGLNLGLWTVRPGTITLPLAKKRGWSVFQALGTPAEDEATDFAKPVIGIGEWKEIHPEDPR